MHTTTTTKDDSYRAYRAQRVFSSLDGLRALSIAAVVWHHSVHIPPQVYATLRGASFGFLGVDLFFVISGFLIVTLLLRERSDHGRISLRSFYARRALRIAPLYYGLLAACALLYFVVRPNGSGAAAFREDLPYLLVYLTNWHFAGNMLAITWSLSTEEQFYLVWPAVERFLGRHALKLLTVVLVLSQVLHFVLFQNVIEAWFGWSSEEPRLLRQTTFTPICLGVLLAHLLHAPRGFAWLRPLLAPRAAAPVALFGLALLTNFFPNDLRGWPRLLLHVWMTFIVGSAVIREDNGMRWLYTLAPVARIGALSYGIYLLHLIGLGVVNAVLKRLGLNPLFSEFILGFALSIALAAISYRYYEAPFLKLKSRFTAQAPQR